MCPVVGCGGQGRFTGDRPVAELMGGNVDGSPACRSIRSGGRKCGTLLGPEGAASCWFPSVPGPGPKATSPILDRAGGLLWGLGFGGVFVNWIVDASI